MSDSHDASLCLGLADQALLNLRHHFENNTEHRPSAAMYEALREMLRVLQEMAEGSCVSSYYLSPLDCGVGKTSAIIEFTKVLLGSPRHSDASVLLCIAKLEEIKLVADKMGLSASDYAAYTADVDCNALGRGKDDAGQARVLFTTQAMIEKRCEGKPFGSVRAFQYRGEPREVRIWDEAILPGQPVVISSDDIVSLYRPLRRVLPELVETLEELAASLKEAESGTVLQFPNLMALHRVDSSKLLALLGNAPEYLKVTAAALGLLSGKPCSVCSTGRFGNNVLSYRDTLPEGFAPPVDHRRQRQGSHHLPSMGRRPGRPCGPQGSKEDLRQPHCSRLEQGRRQVCICKRQGGENW